MTFIDYVDSMNDIREKVGISTMYSPPIFDDIALEFLREYLLGKDWTSPNPVDHEQRNTEMVHAILYKYSRKYRKEYKRRNKLIKDKIRTQYSKSI